MKTPPKIIDVGPPAHPYRVVGKSWGSISGPSLEILVIRRVELQEWRLYEAADPYWRIYWPLTPGGLIWLDKKELKLTPGCVYLIPPHTPFFSRLNRPYAKWFMHFTLGPTADRATPDLFEFIVSPRMKALIKQLAPVLEDDPLTPPLCWPAMELLALTLHLVPKSVWDRVGVDVRFEKALAFMHQHHAEKLTVAALARETALSVRGLDKLFDRHDGLPPMRRLTEIRLDHSSRLLRHSDKSIDQIADECGFANRYYFSRMFRRYRLTTPAAYRKGRFY